MTTKNTNRNCRLDPTRRRYRRSTSVLSCPPQNRIYRPLTKLLFVVCTMLLTALVFMGSFVQSFQQLSSQRFARPQILMPHHSNPIHSRGHSVLLPKIRKDYITPLHMSSSIPRIDISLLENPIITLDAVNGLKQLSILSGLVALLQTIVLSILRFSIKFVRKYLVVMAGIVLIWSVWTVLSSMGRFQKQATSVLLLQKTTKEEEPIALDDDGWGFGTIQSFEPFTENSKICTVRLPQRNWYVPLQLGQPVTVCTMIQHDNENTDNNNNNQDDSSNNIITTYADVYPIATHKSYSKLGQLSFVIPNICKQSTNDHYEEVEANPLKDLAYTLQVGDQIAIQPNPDGSKLVVPSSSNSLSPIELTDYDKIVYVAIGVTGIVPVLGQVETLLSSPDGSDGLPTVEQITILWICESSDDFDNVFSDQLEQLYDNNPDTVLVSCIIDDVIVRGGDDVTAYNNNSDLNESIEQQQYDNDTTRSIGIVSASGYPLSVTDTAMTFLQKSRGFPDHAICVL